LIRGQPGAPGVAMDREELGYCQAGGGLASGEQIKGLEPLSFRRVLFSSEPPLQLRGAFCNRGEGFVHRPTFSELWRSVNQRPYNILRTPDVAADVVAVFEALNLDFIAVAGVQFCCGITWDRFGDVAKGQNVSDLTIQRLASYNSRVVVHWCPSCDVHFSDVVTGRDEKTLPFAVTNTPAFLNDLQRFSGGCDPIATMAKPAENILQSDRREGVSQGSK
jgi:hypothetical protein